MGTLVNNQKWIQENNTKAANGATAPIWLNSALPAPDSRHEAVMFFKPEVPMLGSDKLPPFLKLVDDLCAQYDVEITNIGCLGYAYLGESGIINDHYGVIGRLASQGMKALTPDIQQKVRDTFPDVAEENIYGSLQFLKAYPDLTVDKLGEVWEANNSTKTKKLAPGTHCQPIEWGGKKNMVFVGFYPTMAAHFTSPGRSIIVMTVRSKTAWETLRNTMVGDTDPALAIEGSYRNTLLVNKDQLGLPIVNKGANGIHLSAGALEGMVEIIRFASDRSSGKTLTPAQTNFGAVWLGTGGTASELETLMTNPLLNVNGKTISAFDATEHVDMAPALATLRGALKQAA